MITFCFALSLAIGSPHAQGSEPIAAGVARVDITPPLALKASLGGYGDRMNRPAGDIAQGVLGEKGRRAAACLVDPV